MTASVVTADPATPVREVAALMRERNVGSVVLVRDGAPVGIVTDRDLAIGVLADGRGGDDRASDHASAPGRHRRRSRWTSTAAAELMVRHGIRRLPVARRRSRLTGIVTLDDIAARTGDAELAARARRRRSRAPRCPTSTSTSAEADADGASGPIVVYGATGYTGTLVAHELRRRGLPCVLAGRERRQAARGWPATLAAGRARPRGGARVGRPRRRCATCSATRRRDRLRRPVRRAAASRSRAPPSRPAPTTSTRPASSRT